MPELLNADLETETIKLGQRLKALRLENNWTLEDLARRSDLSPPYLSRLEAGERQPSLATLISLAQAFEIPMAHLFDAPPPPSKIAVTRVFDAVTHVTGNQLKYIPLTGKRNPTHLNAVLVEIPHKRKDKNINHHDSEEFVYILEGSVTLSVGGEIVTLGPGDAAHYDARNPHFMDAVGESAKVLLVASTAPKSELFRERSL